MLTAIYYPATASLSYWIPKEKSRPILSHAYTLKTEAMARAFLREHIIRTEVIQGFEVFK